MTEWLWACLGALFPELQRLYNLRTQELSFPRSYYVLTALFIGGSGLVALALPGTLTPIAAIYAGLAAPVIVSSGADNLVKRLKGGKPSTDQPDDKETVDDIRVHPDRADYVRLGESLFVDRTGIRRFLLSLRGGR